MPKGDRLKQLPLKKGDTLKKSPLIKGETGGCPDLFALGGNKIDQIHHFVTLQLCCGVVHFHFGSRQAREAGCLKTA
jgi:hypothetical protein